MLELFNKEFENTRILENASNIKEQLKINSINTLTFSLPYFDKKNNDCKPYNYVRYSGGQFYRIVNIILDKDETGVKTYECEHVISKLLDTTLDGCTIIGNRGVYTEDVINFILSYPKTKGLKQDWILAECDFKRQFEYKFENENLLGALFSIPQPFSDYYIWKFDTSVYPFRISLKRIDETINPQLYIWNQKNMLKLTKQSDLRQICTCLRPLGYGEGINQLTIKEVNNGKDYIRSPQEYIDKYGLIERVWTDRRYEDAQSLLEAAKAMLKQLQEPLEEYQVDFKQVGNSSFDIAEVGKIVKIIDTETKEEYKTYITGMSIDYNDIEKTKITIANKANNIADTVADLADRQRIEMTYSQGATQMYSQSVQINADNKNSAVIDFFVPSEMRIINKVLLKVRVSPFRAYSKATEGGGEETISDESATIDVTSTESGGSVETTSEAGGGTTTTTGAGGSTVTTTSAGGGTVSTTQNNQSTTSGASSIITTENADVFIQIGNIIIDGNGTYDLPTSPALEGTEFYHTHASLSHGHEIIIDGHCHNMEHYHIIDGHNHIIILPDHFHQLYLDDHFHEIYLPDHEHRILIPAHKHNITIPPHQHKIKLPSHEHAIEPGIYFFGKPKSFEIIVNGKSKQVVASNEGEIDITNYLLGSDKKIARGQWHTIEIKPNDLAYVSATLFVQGFVQSRGDMTV